MTSSQAADRVRTAQILGTALALLKVTSIEASFAIIVLTGLGTLLDSFAVESLGIGTRIVMWIASTIVQCELTRRLLLRAGYPDVRRRYGPMLAIGIATGIPLIIGFILLVLPGLYLLARWSISDVVLLAENTGGAEAIGTSWDRTRSHVPPITAALILAYVPPFILGSILMRLVQPFGLALGSAVSNLTSQIAVACGWYVTVAIHHALRPPTSDLERIFA